MLAKLGYRKKQRSMELKDLVKRLIDENRRALIALTVPLFKDFD